MIEDSKSSPRTLIRTEAVCKLLGVTRNTVHNFRKKFTDFPKPIKDGVVAFGECGLNGEIRKVSHQEKRSGEAKKLGYGEVISSDNTKNIFEAIKKSLSE